MSEKTEDKVGEILRSSLEAAGHMIGSGEPFDLGEFDESKHPRDDNGRWTDDGGGIHKSVKEQAKHEKPAAVIPGQRQLLKAKADGSATPEMYREVLVHAATDHDRRELLRTKGRAGHYNPYALPQYLGGIAEAFGDIKKGKAPRAAILSRFTGKLADHMLKAVGEEKMTDSERRR